MAGTILASSLIAGSATGIPQFLAQRRASKKARKAEEHANQVAMASAQVANARARRRAIAQARLAQAQNVANVGSQVQGSSALAGAQSSITTTLGSNIAAQNAAVRNQQNIFDLQQSAVNAIRAGQEQAGVFNAINQTGQAAFSLFSGSGSPAGLPFGGPNLQGQSTPLFNNSAFVSRF